MKKMRRQRNPYRQCGSDNKKTPSTARIKSTETSRVRGGITYTIEDPGTQPKPFSGSGASKTQKQPQFKPNTLPRQGSNVFTQKNSGRHRKINFWTIQHMPEGVDGPTLARSKEEHGQTTSQWNKSLSG